MIKIVITIYRSPAGNCNYFLRKLDSFLSALYTKKVGFIICGDMNINYLNYNNRRQQSDTLLAKYLFKECSKFSHENYKWLKYCD